MGRHLGRRHSSKRIRVDRLGLEEGFRGFGVGEGRGGGWVGIEVESWVKDERQASSLRKGMKYYLRHRFWIRIDTIE